MAVSGTSHPAGAGFGRTPSTNAYFDQGLGAEIRADDFPNPLGAYPDVWGAMGDELRSAVAEHQGEVWGAVRQFPGDCAVEAPNIVFNHAVNDVIDLVNACCAGSGRSAARAARALYEHLINFCDVAAPGADAQRYVDHACVTAELLARRRPGLSRLSGNALKRETKRLDSLTRNAKSDLAKAITKYRPSFKRQWHAEALYTRAVRHGFEKDYDGYRILSGVLHGNSGSLLGTRRLISGKVIHRTGPDLRLASLAWLEGLTSFRNLAVKLPLAVPEYDPTGLVSATERLLDLWPQMHEVLRRADAALWPELPSPGLLTVVAFYPKGHRWYLYDTEFDMIVVADPPVDESQIIARLMTSKQVAIDSYRPDQYNGRPLTVVVMHAKVQPRGGASWTHSGPVLVPKERPPPRFL